MEDTSKVLHLFAAYGIELEYMIVDATSLAVKPIADTILKEMAGEIVSEVSRGTIAWSNELVMHVLEIKSNGPSKDLAKMHGDFATAVNAMNRLLAAHGAMLMPTAMHPFFKPESETKLWPHDNREIYEAYDRLFSCRGHGWSNLQSIHVNLPFCGDDEFGRLHAAVRLVLPLLPALAASSPIVGGQVTGFMDNRLCFYRENQKRVPSIAGVIIPERVFSIGAYQEQVLDKMYRDVRPHDPKGLLQEEWLNSRGAIPRFDRNAIEIRLLDIQESTRADFAIVAAVVSLVAALVHEVPSSYKKQQGMDEQELAACLSGCIMQGESYVVASEGYLRLLGVKRKAIPAGELWNELMAPLATRGYEISAFYDEFRLLNARGTLARRILHELGGTPKHEPISALYRRLCSKLAEDLVYA